MLQDSFSKRPDLPMWLLCFIPFTGYLLSRGLNINCLCFALRSFLIRLPSTFLITETKSFYAPAFRLTARPNQPTRIREPVSPYWFELWLLLWQRSKMDGYSQDSPCREHEDSGICRQFPSSQSPRKHQHAYRTPAPVVHLIARKYFQIYPSWLHTGFPAKKYSKTFPCIYIYLLLSDKL